MHLTICVLTLIGDAHLSELSEGTPKGVPSSAWLPILIKHRGNKLSPRFLALRCI